MARERLKEPGLRSGSPMVFFSQLATIYRASSSVGVRYGTVTASSEFARQPQNRGDVEQETSVTRATGSRPTSQSSGGPVATARSSPQ